MAIVEMCKIDLIGLLKDKDGILERLMELGVVHLNDPDAGNSESGLDNYAHRDGDSETIQSIEEKIELAASALKFLSQFDNRKKPLFPALKEIPRDKYNSISRSAGEIVSIACRVKELQTKIQETASECGRIQNNMDFLKPWETLDIPLETAGTRHTVVQMGTIPAMHDTQQVKALLYSNVPQCFLEVSNADRDQSYVCLAVHREYETQALQFLKKYGYASVDFKGMTGTAKENLERLSEELKYVRNEKELLLKEAAGFADEINRLEIMHDYLIILRDREKAEFELASTKRIFILNGWLPENISAKVAELVSKDYDCLVRLEKPAEEEDFPILLKNSDIAESVEMITEMYSLPNPREVDPNAVMAPFFILFFGLMLSDAGYGLIMALGSAIVLWKFQLSLKTKRFMKLMLYCGLSTIFWGALFGGWFGDAAAVITGGRINLLPLWFNPLEDPEKLLMWSLAFGIIHIYVGISVRAYNLNRRKKYLDAIFDSLFWYVLFTGAVLVVLPYVPNVDKDWASGFTDIGMKMVIAGAVLLVLTQGRKQKNIIAKFFSGLGSLYDLISFMSDVLSYSRLLALGLATSVIATIINQIGSMAGMDNIFGLVLFIIVFIAGHIFNFLINALGAYVHSSRLQYIEFFGKFYEGGGKPFNPLKMQTKYVKIKSDEEAVINGKLN